MAIFHSYVKLPEGSRGYIPCISMHPVYDAVLVFRILRQNTSFVFFRQAWNHRPQNVPWKDLSGNFLLANSKEKIPPRQTGTTQSAIFVQRSKSHFWHRNQSDVRARGWQKCVVPIENDNCVCRILKSRIFNASNSNVPCLSRLGNYGKLLPLGEGDGGGLSWPIGSIDWSSLTRVLTSVI